MFAKKSETTFPIFPLSGALLLPGGYLPLNIFEPRYINMVDDALGQDRIIGMIQPHCGNKAEGAKKKECPELYKTGCLGKITSFHETDQGTYLITLTGIKRFDTVKEKPSDRGYRLMEVDTEQYENDTQELGECDLQWDCVEQKLKEYLTLTEIECDMDAIEEAPRSRLLAILSMVCPFSSSEKQALLEARNCEERLSLFAKIIDMAIQTNNKPEAVEH